MIREDELRHALGSVADRVAQPHVEPAGLARLGERERRRRHGLAAGAVAALVAVAAVLTPALTGAWDRREAHAPQPAPQPAPRPDHRTEPTLRTDLDGDGRADDVVVDGPAGTVTVTPATGGTLGWSLPHHSAVDLLGAADLGHGTRGLVLEGWTGDGGRHGAVVLVVRDGHLLRARPDGTVIDRDPTQTMWVERGVFRHALCMCEPGPQQVSVYRVELRPDGRTLRSVEDGGRCWNPSEDRPPTRRGWPAC